MPTEKLLATLDTLMGYGIHEMVTGQARRYFPLPDYVLDDPQMVKLTLHGKVVDPAYSRLLIENSELPLDSIFALDRVQKRLPITDDAAKHLRRDKLIEGRKPNYHISAKVADASEQKADYIKTRGLDDAYYKELIIKYIKKFGSATRADIDSLIMNKLSEILDDAQKRNKVSNLITSLRRASIIINKGSDTKSEWHLT